VLFVVVVVFFFDVSCMAAAFNESVFMAAGFEWLDFVVATFEADLVAADLKIRIICTRSELFHQIYSTYWAFSVFENRTEKIPENSARYREQWSQQQFETGSPNSWNYIEINANYLLNTETKKNSNGDDSTTTPTDFGFVISTT